MILAVPYENGEVFQHFGKSKEFQLFDIDNGAIQSERIILNEGSGHGALADLLGKQGVTVLLCGGIGDGAKQALADWGIRVLAGVQGEVKQIVQDYLADRLVVMEGATCNHHEHHSEQEHSCHGDCRH